MSNPSHWVYCVLWHFDGGLCLEIFAKHEDAQSLVAEQRIKGVQAWIDIRAVRQSFIASI